jgi:hypothetical protein
MYHRKQRMGNREPTGSQQETNQPRDWEQPAKNWEQLTGNREQPVGTENNQVPTGN